ncbi:MAG TPA: hypothetical protein PLZ52_05660 [Bacteroidales bacterium]|nr:hypothetical protein [Bacteroidales bacterium]HQL69447.1 hypothetical protein [Bacteroidales bacterium]
MEIPGSAKSASRVVSVLFHPLIVPTLGCFVIFNSGFYIGLLPFKIMQAVYIVVFVLTFVLPALIIPALYLQKYISNIAISERRERILPLAIVAVMYSLSFYFMQRSGFPPILLHFIAGGIVSLVLALLVTLKWKISLHTIGIGGLTALVVYLTITYRLELYTYLMICIVIAGITGTARMIAGSHTPAQIYSGFGLGFLSMYISMSVF